MDFYEVFGLPKTATDEEIQKQYRKLAMQFHPDRNPGDDEAVEKFKKVQTAYEVLGDPEKRVFYDQNGHPPGKRGYQPPSQPPRSDFFRSVFNTFFGGDDRGRHVQVRVELELHQLLKDTIQNITYSKRQICKPCRGSGIKEFKSCDRCLGSGQVVTISDPPFELHGPCPSCNGSGKLKITKCDTCAGSGHGTLKDCKLDVKIPAGIHHGMQVRVPGAGEEGGEGDPPGDLFVVVLTKPHEFFKRDTVDLLTEIPVNYTTLALGGEILIPTLDNSFVNVKVPPGTQPNTRFRLKGRGLPDFRVPKKSGDILATVKLEVPNNVSEEYKEALEKLRENEKSEPTPRVAEWQSVGQDT